jgi:hypothetical protein
MNKNRLLLLADVIERGKAPEAHPDLTFDMGQFWVGGVGAGCGTTACIAGWAVVEFARDEKLIRAPKMADKAQKLLGLDAAQAHELFYAVGRDVAMWNITPKHAAFTLRNLAETGVVDWKKYKPPVYSHAFSIVVEVEHPSENFDDIPVDLIRDAIKARAEVLTQLAKGWLRPELDVHDLLIVELN